MIAIIKYQAGNLASVSNALGRLHAEHIITDEPEQLDRADAVIFPGVGHAGAAMDDLRARDLDVWLKNTQKPVLGICLGMQLFYDSSEEGDSDTLGIIPGVLRKFDSSNGKVPHMGWNSFTDIDEHPVMEGIDNSHFMYYVHSYYAPVNEYTVASCNYLGDFASVVARDNYIGVQFHTEKSGKAGSFLLQNFLDLIQTGSV